MLNNLSFPTPFLQNLQLPQYQLWLWSAVGCWLLLQRNGTTTWETGNKYIHACTWRREKQSFYNILSYHITAQLNSWILSWKHDVKLVAWKDICNEQWEKGWLSILNHSEREEEVTVTNSNKASLITNITSNLVHHNSHLEFVVAQLLQWQPVSHTLASN